MSRKSPLIAALFALALLASACGSEDTTDVSVADDGDSGVQSQPETDGDGDVTGDTTTDGDAPVPVEPDGGIGDGAGQPAAQDADAPVPVEPDGGIGDGAGQPAAQDADAPIPVEPDGGIGDGAHPLPGAPVADDTGTWHGAEVAETNCPGTEWKRIEANAFSFSVPTGFTESDVQPIDSEVGVWTGGNNIEVSYDYGWYSGSINSTPGAENEPIDYGGIAGELTVVRTGESPMIGVLFPEVAVADGQADRLGMLVRFSDLNDEIIGRCIVGSIAFG